MFKCLIWGTILAAVLSTEALLTVALSTEAVAAASRPEDLAGTWSLALDKAGTSCRIMLLAQKSDQGTYFLGLPMACRHAMPALANVGRWSLPDAGHITLADPTGAAVLAFAQQDDGRFAAASAAGTYTLTPARPFGRSAPPLASPDEAPLLEQIATHHRKAEAEDEPVGDLAGRYAVMREKRDTGCMLTLDTSRVEGGERAQLAPGCRDQGIVVFDPTAWQLVKGKLVLTARAGHTTHLDKVGEGAWAKDPAEGKPLGLKKL